jgi:hypothetical protein
MGQRMLGGSHWREPVVNMRVGASESRLYRKAGMATVVCRLAPNNMGAADEYVDTDELYGLGAIITLAALFSRLRELTARNASQFSSKEVSP